MINLWESWNAKSQSWKTRVDRSKFLHSNDFFLLWHILFECVFLTTSQIYDSKFWFQYEAIFEFSF